MNSWKLVKTMAQKSNAFQYVSFIPWPFCAHALRLPPNFSTYATVFIHTNFDMVLKLAKAALRLRATI